MRRRKQVLNATVSSELVQWASELTTHSTKEQVYLADICSSVQVFCSMVAMFAVDSKHSSN